MKTYEDIRRDVKAELRFDPDIDANDIAVAVTDGVVTLAGFAHSYAQKWEAECAAWRPPDVREVENLLSIKVWPMPSAGASRRWLTLQRRRQGCFSL